MKIVPYESVESNPVKMEGALGCRIRNLIGPLDDAPNFYMRQFEIAPGGQTPKHSHPYEHEVFILEGEGVVYLQGNEHPLEPGYVVYVPADDPHQFRNVTAAPLKFLCLIPHPSLNRSQPDTLGFACDK